MREVEAYRRFKYVPSLRRPLCVAYGSPQTPQYYPNISALHKLPMYVHVLNLVTGFRCRPGP